MSSVRTPQEKKRLAYERDHYAKRKQDKARGELRTKKEKARRSYRHAVDSLAKKAPLDGEADAKISAIKQRRVITWQVAPSLKDRITRKIERRVRSVGAKKARREYRLKFQAMLTALLSKRRR